ncbi:hypothetical protein MBLNU459_g5974t1 [Dothideomycetes sp. NU459]
MAATPPVAPMIPVRKVLFVIDVHVTRSLKPPAMIPEPTDPQIAPPRTKMALEGAAAHNVEPVMKTKMHAKQILHDGRFGGLPIVGHSLSMFERPRGDIFIRWMKELPDSSLIYFRGLFNADRLVVNDHQALSEILVTKSYDFEKPAPIRNFLRDILGDGLVVIEGEDHAFLRKNLMPAFNFRHIKELHPVFWNKALQMTQGIAQQMAESPETSIELNHWANQVTMDIIGLAAMGRDFQCLKEGGRHPLIQNYEELLEPTLEKQMYYAARILGPSELIKKLPWRLNSRMKIIISNLTNVCLQLVQDKKTMLSTKTPEQIDVANRDILTLLIRSGNFSDRQLVDQLLTFLAAGHETTSSAFTWTAHLLATHPAIQDSLREEIYASIASPRECSPTNFDLAATLESLPLLNGVCHEANRLYPAVPITVRRAVKTTSIVGQIIPKGTQILLVPWATNRNTALWGPTATEFDPYRWIDTDPKTGKQRPNNSGGASSNYAFLTFLHGPRSCIGQGFAKAELRCLVAAFVGCFEMAMARPDEKIVPHGVITTKPEKGMHLRLRHLQGWRASGAEG